MTDLFCKKLGKIQTYLQMMIEKIPQQEFMVLQEEMMKKLALINENIDTSEISNKNIIRAFKKLQY